MKKLPSREMVKNEIEQKRNHSWFREIVLRHQNELDRVILKYWGNEITYRKFVQESYNWAKALKQNGLQKGTEFIVCLDRTPEVVYLLGAASIIGAEIHLISEKFQSDFIKKLIEGSTSGLVFVQDTKISYMKNILKSVHDKKIIPVPYRRSLKHKYSFENITNYFYNLDKGDYQMALSELDNIYSLEDFLESGNLFQGKVEEVSTLDDPFTITYSSGTTKQGRPKGIRHVNRHYITMGRYHDPEVSGVPAMRNISTYSNIPVYSNSYLLSSLSDNLIQGGTVILDPIDNPEYFLWGIKFNRGNMNIATTSTWLITAMKYYRYIESGEVQKFYLRDALFNFAGGEALGPGEEKFLNKFLKDSKAGINLSHTPVSIAKMSTAGADCEHGSILIRIFRAYFNKSPYRLTKTEPIGMKPYAFVDIKALREDGTYAAPYEYGRLVANSDCSMKEYHDNPEATKDFYIKDAYGKVWGDMNVYGYLDEKNNVTMKGRMNSNKNYIPEFLIADEIEKDTKKILSCEVVLVDDSYVAHIIFQPHTSINEQIVLQSAMDRCVKKFGNAMKEKLYFRIRNHTELFPLTSSIKRNSKALMLEGMNQVENMESTQKVVATKKRVKQ